MQNPLVSILIPFKNTEAYIEDCITSILQQTYTNWEAICIDDNSTDDTAKIIETYAKTSTKIQLQKNRGHGIIEALRTAFSKAKGTYISRMDSDDIMAPHRLSWMVTQLLDSGKGYISIGQVKYFRADGLNSGYRRYESWLNTLTSKGTNYSEIYKECVIPSPCWLIHREDLEDCGAFTPNNYPEDYDLAFRFYKANYRCIPCDTILHFWRDYDQRTSRTHKHYADNYFLNLKLQYFIDLDYNPTQHLTLWGAGKKGKTIAKWLLEHHIAFYWVCNNTNKIGKAIYGKTLNHYTYVEQLKQPQIIVSVANEKEQTDITDYFKQHKLQPMQDYFFFC